IRARFAVDVRRAGTGSRAVARGCSAQPRFEPAAAVSRRLRTQHVRELGDLRGDAALSKIPGRSLRWRRAGARAAANGDRSAARGAVTTAGLVAITRGPSPRMEHGERTDIDGSPVDGRHARE